MGNYLVSGAAGFIASRVVDLLLQQGHQVIGVDNINDAYDIRLKEWRLRQLEHQAGFTFQIQDICQRDLLRPAFETGLDAVINLAARAGVRQSVEDPWAYYETNVTGTLNLLELCREFGVKKFILASTSSLYGANNPQPFREDANTDGPLSPYAASKKAAEVLCYTYHHLYGIDISIPRFFTVYGPAGRPDMSLFRFVQWIAEGHPLTLYGDGSQSRDFTYVDDIARGTVAALRPVGFEVINLGSDRPAVLMDTIHLVEQEVGRKARIHRQPRHPADVMATWADIEKARRLLQWEPSITLQQGVQNSVAWYMENRRWAKDIHTG